MAAGRCVAARDGMAAGRCVAARDGKAVGRCVVALLVLACLPLATSHEQHGPIDIQHYEDGKHNEDFDHAAILGSQDALDEFAELAPEEAKKRLATIALKMDLNKDNFVTQDELTTWVLNSYVSLNEEEAGPIIVHYDSNGDGSVTWKEYLDREHGYTLAKLEADRAQRDEDLAQLLQVIEENEMKFQVADEDKSGSLDLSEFAAFTHPYDYEHMYDFEVNMTLKAQDQNKDGVIDFNEYSGEEDGEGGVTTKEDKVVNQEQFEKYDINKDGNLDSDEIKAWVLPNNTALAIQEAVHLILETDTDKDGQLTVDEIVAKYKLWVGSSSQSHLHDPQEL